MEQLELAIREFLQHCLYEKNLSKKTLKAYNIDLNQFKLHIEQTDQTLNDLSKFNKAHIKSYLKVVSHFKPKTIKRKIASTKAFFNYLEFEDVILVNPFRKMRIQIKEPLQLPKVMTLNEIKSILKVAYSIHYNVPSKNQFEFSTSLRDIAVLEVLFATGMRVSELCNLKQNEISLKTGLIQVNGKGGKQRLIQLCNAETLHILKSYQALFSTHEYFFINRLGNRLSEQSVRAIVKKYKEAANLNRNITPHTFRHTFATLLLEEDVDIKYIQQLLGHSSIMTTQIYTHVNNAKQKQILSTKHPRKSFSSKDFV